MNRTYGLAARVARSTCWLALSFGITGFAWGDCPPGIAGTCGSDAAMSRQDIHEAAHAGLGFAIEPGAAPVSYPAALTPPRLKLEAGLGFDLPGTGTRAAASRPAAALSVADAGEAPFALLFGSLARLMSDGSVAFGSGSGHTHRQPQGTTTYPAKRLPRIDAARVPELDVDLGLSYAADERFRTSVGYADSLSEAAPEHAFVGWFEFRF